MSAKKVVYRVDLGADKKSDQARLDRVGVVGSLAPQTPLYQSDPAFKKAVDDYGQAGDDFSTKSAAVAKLEADLDAARGTRDNSRVVLDLSHGVCAKHVEKHSATPADLQSFGFPLMEKVDLGLLLPVGIDASYDPKTLVLDIHVLYATRGKRTCVIEISPEPIGPATFKRLEGTGVMRALTGYAPGTWWVRAATTKATERSDWFGPIAVIVK